MKKRSGEAQAAQHRPPVVMKHRLTPRGGSQVDPDIAEQTEECAHEAYSAPGADTGDFRVYCDLCGVRL
jgi:hypothetical protein